MRSRICLSGIPGGDIKIILESERNRSSKGDRRKSTSISRNKCKWTKVTRQMELIKQYPTVLIGHI